MCYHLEAAKKTRHDKGHKLPRIIPLLHHAVYHPDCQLYQSQIPAPHAPKDLHQRKRTKAKKKTETENRVHEQNIRTDIFALWDKDVNGGVVPHWPGVLDQISPKLLSCNISSIPVDHLDEGSTLLHRRSTCLTCSLPG